MANIDIDEYKEEIKGKRNEWFIQPYDLVYKQFEEYEFHLKAKEYFIENASFIVEKLREASWEYFHPKEKQFTSFMLQKLVSKEEIRNLNGLEAITYFIESFPEHIYALTLSNTQSRRSRAGKEFEAIIEIILIGANIPMDSQGNIGKKVFMEKGLGKMVDIVSPGAIEYIINKRNTILISAKTTLRERWQEVPEEMERTGAREMFLITLDENISAEVIETLYDNNIQIVTTRNNKKRNYSSYNNVLDMEELLDILSVNAMQWKNYMFSEKERTSIRELIKKQLDKHSKHQFVRRYYEQQLERL